MRKMAQILVLSLALPAIGCQGYRVVRRSGWRDRSRVAEQQYSLRSINGNDYWTAAMLSPNSPKSALYIPNYSYHQGLVYSPKDITIVGQVRVIGGIVGQDDVYINNGAMVTTNPEALQNRIQPSRFRYQISNWKEVP
jgi:hypothetical protein